MRLNGSGPNKLRQESSHAHQVVWLEDYKELLVPDLGGDKVWRFVRNQDGSWTPKGYVEYEAGGGPRHVAFYGMHFTFIPLSTLRLIDIEFFQTGSSTLFSN